jgi:hypothetical protein
LAALEGEVRANDASEKRTIQERVFIRLLLREEPNVREGRSCHFQEGDCQELSLAPFETPATSRASQERLHDVERTVTIDEVHSLHLDPVSRLLCRQIVEVEAAMRSSAVRMGIPTATTAST